MHYGGRYFSKNRKLTIRTKKSRHQKLIGQRTRLSNGADQENVRMQEKKALKAKKAKRTKKAKKAKDEIKDYYKTKRQEKTTFQPLQNWRKGAKDI